MDRMWSLVLEQPGCSDVVGNGCGWLRTRYRDQVQALSISSGSEQWHLNWSLCVLMSSFYN